MDRYLIETPHTGLECLELIKLINAQGYLWNFDWGCEAGVHSGWAIIEAENEAQARLAVPPLVRSRARITKLNKFDAKTIEDHEKQEAVTCELNDGTIVAQAYVPKYDKSLTRRTSVDCQRC